MRKERFKSGKTDDVIYDRPPIYVIISQRWKGFTNSLLTWNLVWKYNWKLYHIIMEYLILEGNKMEFCFVPKKDNIFKAPIKAKNHKTVEVNISCHFVSENILCILLWTIFWTILSFSASNCQYFDKMICTNIINRGNLKFTFVSRLFLIIY